MNLFTWPVGDVKETVNLNHVIKIVWEQDKAIMYLFGDMKAVVAGDKHINDLCKALGWKRDMEGNIRP